MSVIKPWRSGRSKTHTHTHTHLCLAVELRAVAKGIILIVDGHALEARLNCTGSHYWEQGRDGLLMLVKDERRDEEKRTKFAFLNGSDAVSQVAGWGQKPASINIWLPSNYAGGGLGSDHHRR